MTVGSLVDVLVRLDGTGSSAEKRALVLRLPSVHLLNLAKWAMRTSISKANVDRSMLVHQSDCLRCIRSVGLMLNYPPGRAS